MDGAATVADSHDWERDCKQLLSLRYQGALQLIDATRDGDLGLEAFTRLSGHAFQSYAPIEPLSAKARYEKHRDKLTTDLMKLAENEVRLAKILGATKICSYYLMVPQFDTRLLDHCAKKRDELRRLNLGILSDDFEIFVQTRQDYPTEAAQLIEAAIQPLNLQLDEIKDDEHEHWAGSNLPLVQVLTTKLAKLGQAPAVQVQLRKEFLKHYLRREQLLQQIFDEAPETHIRLTERIRQREQLLAASQLLTSSPPLDHARSSWKSHERFRSQVQRHSRWGLLLTGCFGVLSTSQ
jgi:hypothetical protein